MTAKKAVEGRGHKARAELVEETRPERISVAKQRDKLTVAGQDPNRQYRWVNDIEDGQRIYVFEQAGYRIETNKTLKVGQRKMSDSKDPNGAHRAHAGTDKEGNTVYAYLMSIDKAWYQEDQEEKQVEIDNKEKGIGDQGDYGTVEISDDGRSRNY